MRQLAYSAEDLAHLVALLPPELERTYRHDLYLAFIGERGWSMEPYKAWLYATLCRLLLPDFVVRAAVERGSPAIAGTSFEAALAELP